MLITCYTLRIYQTGSDVLIYLLQTSLLVIGLLSIVTLITTSILISPAFALKRFFNCMTNIVNKTGKLTIDDTRKMIKLDSFIKESLRHIGDICKYT